MSDTHVLAARAYQLFTDGSRALFEKYRQTSDQDASLLSIRKTAAPRKQYFSHFDNSDLVAAREVYSHLMDLADSIDGNTGLERVLDEVSRLAGAYHPDLLYYALMVFITHHDKGRVLRIPGIEERMAHLLVPSPARIAAADADGPDESVLNWFREDPLMGEHHEHWHVVFPTAGLVDEYGTPRLKDRHGELFFYMHRQMLARYDTERLCAGMKRVIPFDNLKIPILEGYDPGYLTSDGYMQGYGVRPPNSSLGDTWYSTLEAAIDRQRRLREAEESGQLRRYHVDRNLIRELPGISEAEMEAIYAELIKNGTVQDPGDLNTIAFNPDDPTAKVELSTPYEAYIEPLSELIRTRYTHWAITVNLLADTVETNIQSIDSSTLNRSQNFYYGNYHGLGHILSALITPDKPGVMFNTAVAQRDPFFYRWHKEVDNQWFRWEQSLEPEDFSDYPKVSLRKGIDAEGRPWSPDIILVNKNGLPGVGANDFDGQKEGEIAFGTARGNTNFDLDFSKGTYEISLGKSGFKKKIQTTDTLKTYMAERSIVYKFQERENGPIEEKKVDINYLNHPDYYYFLRVQNNEPFFKKVTVRIWLCPERDGLSEDRTMWIELDKFVHELKPLEKAVVYRPAELSSVIRKPAIKDPASTQPKYNKPDPGENEELYYCECGWPYSMLLPRGTREGEEFKLMVMITDFEIDHVDDEDCCGSMSFCGSRSRYPDSRTMGYPFHKPFRDGVSIADLIASQPNMASRIIKIQETDAPESIS